MFLISTKYLKPAEEVGKFRDAHLAHFKRFAEAKKLLVGGRRADGSGAFLVWVGDDRAELDGALASDPYATSGCARVESVSEFAGHLLAPAGLTAAYG